MRLIRLLLCGGLLALPVTCQQPNGGPYRAGIEPSPAGRVNPEEPHFVNSSNAR